MKVRHGIKTTSHPSFQKEMCNPTDGIGRVRNGLTASESVAWAKLYDGTGIKSSDSTSDGVYTNVVGTAHHNILQFLDEFNRSKK
jgi:hypothetical protein